MNFFKLMTNGYYGKTLENVRDRPTIAIVQGQDEYKKAVAHPLTKRITNFGDNVYAIHRYKKNVKMDKFPYVGFVILKLSKLLTKVLQ